jgi:hypothetical protein
MSRSSIKVTLLIELFYYPQLLSLWLESDFDRVPPQALNSVIIPIHLSDRSFMNSFLANHAKSVGSSNHMLKDGDFSRKWQCGGLVPICYGKKIRSIKHKQALRSQFSPIGVNWCSGCPCPSVPWYNDYRASAQFSCTWINGFRVRGGLWLIDIHSPRWRIHILFGRTSSVHGKSPYPADLDSETSDELLSEVHK